MHIKIGVHFLYSYYTTSALHVRNIDLVMLNHNNTSCDRLNSPKSISYGSYRKLIIWLACPQVMAFIWLSEYHIYPGVERIEKKKKSNI